MFNKSFGVASELRNEIRYALRSLINSPGFTLGAVAILTLAIGANTTLFTFFSAYLLKPLPMKDPERNVELAAKQARGRQLEVWSYPDFVQLRRQNQAFEEMYAWAPVNLPVREPAPRTLKAVLVSGDFFRIFQAKMALGRALSPEEDQAPGRDAVVVLSHHAWQSIFNADPGIVGRTLRIRQTGFTIIGVTDPAFIGADPITVPDLWAPVVMRDQLVPEGGRLIDPGNAWLKVAGILKPGLSLAQASDSMHGTTMGLNAQRRPAASIEKISLRPRRTYIPLAAEVLTAVVLVFTAFALVLLIACANLAGILLARGVARQREFAIRAALGATRGRLLRQLLTESVLLCALAAPLSLLLTQAGTNAIQQYVCSLLIKDGFHVTPVTPDWRVFLYGTTLALAVGILLGLAPALEATRLDLAGRMKTGAAVRPQARSRRIRELLLVGQVAASLVLLVIAGLFIRSAQRVHRADLGFDANRLIDIRASGSKSQLAERLREDPRFEAVSEVFRNPLGPHGLFALPGQVDGRTLPLGFNYVDSWYFETLGLRVRRGRVFTAQEVRAQAPVVVVSEATARLLWPSEDPVGKTLEVIGPAALGIDPRAVRFSAGKYAVTGVVSDMLSGIWSGAKDRTAIYLPALPGDPRNGSLIVRSRDTSPATMAHLKKTCADLEGVSACAPVTLGEIAENSRFPFVAASALSSGVGALALVMACIGLYGAVAFAVVQRTREIGIRMALGATPGSVLRSVLTGSVLRVAVGIAIGIPLCLAFSKIAGSVFHAVDTFDLTAYLATPLCLAAVALTAAYIPGRRATRIDPISALRQE